MLILLKFIISIALEIMSSFKQTGQHILIPWARVLSIRVGIQIMQNSCAIIVQLLLLLFTIIFD